MFKTNDTAWFRIHKDDANLMQVIYQIISAYFEDDCADELTNGPVMTAILDKAALASQPTLSRFFNRMDKDTLEQLPHWGGRHLHFDVIPCLLFTYVYLYFCLTVFQKQQYIFHPRLIKVISTTQPTIVDGGHIMINQFPLF